MGSGSGMDMDMDNMQWPERCRRHCIYKKRNSYDDRMYCFARSEYSQSMCLAGDYDGQKPVNVDEFGSEYEYSGYGSGYGYGMGGSGSGYGMGSGSGYGMGGSGSGYGMVSGSVYGMGGSGSGMGSGSEMEPMAEPIA